MTTEEVIIKEETIDDIVVEKSLLETVFNSKNRKICYYSGWVSIKDEKDWYDYTEYFDTPDDAWLTLDMITPELVTSYIHKLEEEEDNG